MTRPSISLKKAYYEDRWIRGSSPRMTTERENGTAVVSDGAYRIVLRAVQNPRRHAAADQFADRARPRRRASAGAAVGPPRPQADGCVLRAARDLRIFTAGESGALSP